MIDAVEERFPRLGEVRKMAGKPAHERCEVASGDSSLTFFAMTTANPVYGKATELRGYIDAAWTANGTLAREPAPKMHVEFSVERLRTGNDLQDREMWKLIDSKRFPKIAGDLGDLRGDSSRGRYVATGIITLAGLARKYEGEFRLERDAKHVTLDGELEVDVRDFGLKGMNLLVLSVEPLVRVRLHLIAARPV